MRAMAVAVTLGLGACSFIGMQGPPSVLPDDGPVECTKGRGLMFVDIALATVELGVSGGIYLTERGNPDRGFLPRELVLAPIAIIGAIHALSAIHGHSVASDCERATAELASRPRSPISPTPAGATSGML